MREFMISEVALAFDWARQFNDEGLHIVLMVLAMCYIMLRKEEKDKRRIFVGYICLFTALYFCPPVVYVITKFIGKTVYWRMLWLIPMPAVIAYVMVKIWTKQKNKVIRAGLLAAFVLSLTVTGQVVYLENSPYEEAVNWKKIPESPSAICEIINANRNGDEWVLLGAPEDMAWYIRQYDPSMHLIKGRKGVTWDKAKFIDQQISAQKIKYKKLCRRMRKIQCNYIVLPEGEGRIEGMAKYGYEVIGYVGTYVIYKDMQWTPQN